MTPRSSVGGNRVGARALRARHRRDHAGALADWLCRCPVPCALAPPACRDLGSAAGGVRGFGQLPLQPPPAAAGITGEENEGAGFGDPPWSPVAPLAGRAVGFPSDEGVRRNQGRIGAAGGPEALRRALGSLTDPGVPLRDAGDVPVGEDLEAGQKRLGAVVAAVLATGDLPIVLGGGHEVAYGSYLGWSSMAGAEHWGVVNLDAHFDLRDEPCSTSGTPFRQIQR